MNGSYTSRYKIFEIPDEFRNDDVSILLPIGVIPIREGFVIIENKFIHLAGVNMREVRRSPIRPDVGRQIGEVTHIALRVTEFDALRFQHEEDPIPGLVVMPRLEGDTYGPNQRMVIIGEMGTLIEFGDWIIMLDGEAVTVVSNEEFELMYEIVKG